jgi:hypothetical protein
MATNKCTTSSRRRCPTAKAIERKIERKGLGHGGDLFVHPGIGDYLADYRVGRGWAKLFVPFLKYNVGAPMLSWIVRDMIQAGACTGLEFGFMREIADQLGEARATVLLTTASTRPDASKVLTQLVAKARKDTLEKYSDAMV